MIYFMQAGEIGIKIGYTRRDAAKRVREVQMYCPLPVHLLSTHAGCPSIESALHDRFAAHRIRGDWFHPVPDVLVASASKNLAAMFPLSELKKKQSFGFPRLQICDEDLIASGRFAFLKEKQAVQEERERKYGPKPYWPTPPTPEQTHVRAIIARLGGPTAVSLKLGFKSGRVRMWGVNGRIPEVHHTDLVRISDGNLTFADLTA